MTTRDSFADIDRVKRELLGAESNIDRVLQEAQQRSNLGSQYSRPAVVYPASNTVYPSTYPPQIYKSPYPQQTVPPLNSLGGTNYSSYQPISKLAPPARLSGTSITPLAMANPQPTTFSGGANAYPSARSYSPIQVRYNGTPTPGQATGNTVRILPGTQPKYVQPNYSPPTIGTGSSIQKTSPYQDNTNVQEVIFNTIEEYIEKKGSVSNQENKQQIAKHLLPSDVYYLYSEQKAISQDFNNLLKNDKKLVSVYLLLDRTRRR